jgi:hypothetical protein
VTDKTGVLWQLRGGEDEGGVGRGVSRLELLDAVAVVRMREGGGRKSGRREGALPVEVARVGYDGGQRFELLELIGHCKQVVVGYHAACRSSFWVDETSPALPSDSARCCMRKCSAACANAPCMRKWNTPRRRRLLLQDDTNSRWQCHLQPRRDGGPITNTAMRGVFCSEMSSTLCTAFHLCFLLNPRRTFSFLFRYVCA